MLFNKDPRGQTSISRLDKLRSFGSSWSSEIIAWVCALAFLVAMMVLLGAYNGHPIFRWHGVTLNAMVSVLSTANKAALMFSLAGTVGQWKWILFSDNSRPLMDFEKVDCASRGPWGSFRLLWPTMKVSYLRIGAIVTVLALALDPFAQQLVQYRQQIYSAPDPQAQIARAQRYSKGSSNAVSLSQGRAFADADFSMQSAILYGLAQPYDAIVQQTSFSCASGNCNWTSFESIGVCGVCYDITAHLSQHTGIYALYPLLDRTNGGLVTGEGLIHRLPNGLFITNLNSVPYSSRDMVRMTAYGTGNSSRSIRFQDNDSMIWTMSFLNIQPPANFSAVWLDLQVQATECGLYYCVKRTYSRVVNGTLDETEDVAPDATRNADSWQLMDNYSSVIDPDSLLFDYDTSGYGKTDLMYGNGFNMSQAAVDSISSYFQTQFRNDEDFSVNLTERNFTGLTADDDLVLNGFYLGPSNGTDYVQYSPSVAQVLYESSDLDETFTCLARSMSNAIRAGSDNSTVHIGESQSFTTLFHIKWPWISLHILLLLAVLGFIMITIHETKLTGVPVWKSNSLASFSQRLNVGDPLQGLVSIRHMEKKASEHHAKLFPGTRSYQSLDSSDIIELVEPRTPGRYNTP